MSADPAEIITTPSPAETAAELINSIKEEQPEATRTHTENFKNLEPEDMALALESVPLESRLPLWREVPDEEKIEVLIAMHGEARLLLLREIPEEEFPDLFDELDAEELIELAETVPGAVVDLALSRMDAKQRKFYDDAQQYAEDAIGRWLNHDILIVPQNTRVSEALRLLRREAPEYTEVIYLVDRIGRWAGCAKINKLLAGHVHQHVAELKEEDYPVLEASQNMYEAAELLEKSGYIALPVVNENGVLLGRIEVGTAMELLREQAENQLMATAGLAEGADLFAPIKRSAQNRAVWLGINLLTAFLASWFIGLFEGTIQNIVALAVLMPVVASMGGIAGSQTLTLIVRGLALNQITKANMKALLYKELGVGLLNGILWAIVIGFIAYAWFESALLGLVIATAIVVNIVTAAVSGVLIPILLDKFDLDPALSGSVILTTVTDVVGFVAFLGLGTLILL